MVFKATLSDRLKCNINIFLLALLVYVNTKLHFSNTFIIYFKAIGSRTFQNKRFQDIQHLTFHNNSIAA